MKLLRARWQGAVLVCGKCSKRQKGGFGPRGKTPLSKALRKALKAGKGRKAVLGVVETKCLGVCPKHAVTVLNAGRARDWLLVQPGTPINEVADALGLDPLHCAPAEAGAVDENGVISTTAPAFAGAQLSGQ